MWRGNRGVSIPGPDPIVAALDRLAAMPYLGTALEGRLKGLQQLDLADDGVLCEVRHDGHVLLVVGAFHNGDA